MAKDYWPLLYEDVYAVCRLIQTSRLGDVRNGMTVLDVGCHNGEFRNYLPKNIEYTGIDNLNGCEIDGGFEMSKNYDRIFCLETLEHLKYPQKTLKSISNHLNEEGLAIISLPNEATLFHRVRSLFGTIDSEAFSENGKHLHLPNYCQSFEFVTSLMEFQRSEPYYNWNFGNSRSGFLTEFCKIIPTKFLDVLGGILPLMFARGFIFVCKQKTS